MATRRLTAIYRHILCQSSVPASRNPTFQTCSMSSMQNQMSDSPSIEASPRVALYDEKINIKLNNFPRHEKITLHGQYVQGEKKVIFASCGHYMSDEFGQVNVAGQHSTGGSYTGLEPMGFLWSLQSAPGQPYYSRMLMRFHDRPMIISLKTYIGHLHLEDIYETQTTPESLADIELERWLRFPSEVTRIEVHAGNVRGALFLPPGDGPFQGVIDMFGSAGGLIEYRAALLASRGFAALSLPFFRYQDLPSQLIDVTFDYFEEAVDWLSSHPKVLPHGIGVVAVSKGVEYAYCMSAYLEKVKCVVAINGHPFHGLNDFYHKGKLLCKGSPFDLSLCELAPGGEMIIAKGVPFMDNLIPAWQGDAKHLIIVSEDDYQLDIESYKLLIDACPEEKKNNFEAVRYPGAGHLLEPPYTSLCRSFVNPTFKVLMLFGGQMKEHAHAQEDSWKRILNYLRTNIPTS